MVRIFWIVGGYYLLTGAMMWVQPATWYAVTPGVAPMGPFNQHFIRDIALALTVSGLAILHGARTQDRGILLTGLGWPALHALYHLGIWMELGVPLDTVAFINLLGIQLPVWTSLAIASSIPLKEPTP